MKLTIIGAGNVGKAIARNLKEKDFEISFEVRNPQDEKYTTLKDFKIVPLGDSVASADLILLAIPWSAVDSTVEIIKEKAKGKIIIDATNPLKADLSGLMHLDGMSGGERIQSLLPQSKVIKTFNTTGSENMEKVSEFDQSPTMQLAGDDSKAKEIVSKFITQVGFSPVDSGPLSRSNILEYVALNWISLAYKAGQGTHYTFSIVRRS